MSSKECCKSCKYSRALEISSNGWCLLRKIKLHSEIASIAFCHHWGQQDSSLSALDANTLISDTQLDFGKELVTH